MAFDIKAALGYGTGNAGDVTDPENYINSYARIAYVDGNKVTLGAIFEGTFDKFTSGVEVFLINVDGAWQFAKIESVENNILTLSQPVTIEAWSSAAQIITVPNFKTLTLTKECTLKPKPTGEGTDEAGKKCGGIIVFKCAELFDLAGGFINLNGSFTGFRKSKAANVDADYRYDTFKRAGWENYDTVRHFLLTSSGGAFIVAKKLKMNAAGRIGNPNTYGVARCRGADDSVNKPEGVTNQSGATILIAAETIENFNPAVLAKYKTGDSASSPHYFARCYVATETELPFDEALYAHDRISTPTRLQDTFNIKSFGDGSNGIKENYTGAVNNYAKVASLNASRNVLTVNNKTTNGLAAFKAGALVLVLLMHKNQSYVADSGRFFVSKLAAVSGNTFTLEDSLPNFFALKNYDAQIISIPQFTTFNLGVENSATVRFLNGRGGVFAIACSQSCNLSNGFINVEGKGTGINYGSNGLKYIDNANMATKLPLGAGHGSVLILANALTMNSVTRIGASYDGASLGGNVHQPNTSATNPPVTYGWRGFAYTVENKNTAGSGIGGGEYSVNGITQNGGFGGNASGGSCQGAHIMLIADTLTGFNIHALSTGGAGGLNSNSTSTKTCEAGGAQGQPGGAGYGGAGAVSGSNYRDILNSGTGGGLHGGGAGFNSWITGGGASGFAFVFANKIVNQDTTEITL